MSLAPEKRAARGATVADLERLSAQGFRYELIRGELIEMSPTGGLHGSATDRFAAYVRIHVDEFDQGECFAAETGFLLRRHPDTTYAPDWAFVAKGRVPEPLPASYVPVVPDMVLETRSPGDTKREVALKIEIWLNAGVRMALALDPAARTLTVYQPEAKPEVLGVEDTFSGEEVLPGFILPVRKLFRV